MGQLMHDYMVAIVALIGMIVWSIRLEVKVHQHEKEIDSLDKRLTDFDSKILSKLSEISERLSFIEGRLRGENHSRE